MLHGPQYLLKGFGLIIQPGVRLYVVVPLLINVLIFAGVIVYGAHLYGDFIEWLVPDWLVWLNWLLWPLFAIVALVLVFFCFAIIANLVGAPFNGFLAEAIETKLTGRAHENQSEWTTLPRQMISSLFAELHKLVYFVLWAIPLLILFLIPGLNVAAPFLWILFSAWVLALEYASYPMENHGITFKEQRRLLASKRLLALSYGGTALVITVIPILNFIAMPVAVAGATAMWVDQLAKTMDGDDQRNVRTNNR